MTAQMTAQNLIECLAGEMLTEPALLVEIIREDEEALAVVRQYGRGKASYEEVRNAVSCLV